MRFYGKSKSWFALWNSGPRPERHGHESLCTGGGKVYRCHRFCVRVRRERSIHRKAFSGSVNLGIIRNGADGISDIEDKAATFERAVHRTADNLASSLASSISAILTPR